MALLILPSMALAQGARYDGVAQKTVQGFIAPIAGATITVCTSSATGTPCSPLVTTSPVTLCTDATCTVAASNPFLADANGNFGFWATPGSYKVSITAAGVTGQLLTVTLPCAAGISCVSTSSNNTFTGNNTHSGTETFANINGVVVVDGVTYPHTAAGIQAAINAAPSGGEVYLPWGSYTFGAGDSCINVTKPLHIRGTGLHAGTIISVAAAVPTTTDIFCITPTSDGEAITFSGFEIIPASGTPARYAFHLNSTVASMQTFQINNVEVLQLGSYAVFAEGSGNGQGVPSVSTFEQNVFYGGIVMNNAGDTVRILNNIITGVGKMDFSFQPGSSTLTIKNNNITVDGGIHIGTSGIFPLISENEFETESSGAPGSNGAYVDIDGTAVSFVAGANIYKNSFQIVNGSTLNCLRINFADATTVRDNRFGIGGGAAKGIVVTANATGTRIRTNNFGGATIANALSDSASAGQTTYEFGGQNDSSHPLVFRDSSGTTTISGFGAQAFGFGANGANDLLDGVGNNVALTAAGSPSTAPVAGTVTSVNQLAVKQPIINAANTATMGLTLKKGSGAGNYTNATTSYTVADATNLCYTVTIPTGWKLGISASGYLSTATAAVVAQAALTDNAACSTANAGVLVETAPIQGAGIGVADGFALNWVITGDGAAHNIALQFKTSNAADTASLINSSATVTPTIKFELTPSN